DRVLSPSGPRATVASIQGELYRVSATGSAVLAAGAPIGENEEIRTGKNSRAIVKLRDGSSVELAERTDLALTERWRGKTVHLARGAVMVEAAKQRSGRLEISTPDAMVSVKGTIFEVSSGIKGSRVSVVQGEVKVDHDGSTALLHRGDQKTTSQTMEQIPVAEDVAWSANSAKYLALLGELSAIQKRIEQIPGPALRYQSKLAGLLPENTLLFASIPNLGTTLAEATGIFEERVRQSDVLREWWNDKETQQLKTIVDQARTFNAYLGDEIVLALPAGRDPAPLLIAEARRPGLRAFLDHQFPGMVLEDPSSGSAPFKGPRIMIHGNVVAVAGDAKTLARIATLADAGGNSAFLETPFWKRISQTYASGAGWIFAVDMEQILGGSVSQSDIASGFDNVNFLTIERKENLGRTETSAALDFSGERHGIMSWLAAPGPMGTLDFISPDATFAASSVIKNPAALLQDLAALAGPKMISLDTVQQNTGVNLLTDVAQNIGGEFTIALDGPLLPTPAWKAAIEVNDPVRIEWAIEQAAAAASITVSTGQSNGLTYHSFTLPSLNYQIDYTFTDGYLLAAPSPELLQAAIATRASGLTLEHSSAFRAQLPQDRQANFSALLYYNMGSTVGPIVDQLKAGKLMTPQQEKSAALLTENREPGMIFAYGEPDRIVVASRGGFFGLGLDTLLRLNAKGAAALPQLLPPILNLHASGH
ncbi:MAG TPA: FecR domain-containing protein, partial [Bryobacteraceae bacterium]|nr:FecR domain-containing protein [Bryobacteraceae bacterium]